MRRIWQAGLHASIVQSHWSYTMSARFRWNTTTFWMANYTWSWMPKEIVWSDFLGLAVRRDWLATSADASTPLTTRRRRTASTLTSGKNDGARKERRAHNLSMLCQARKRNLHREMLLSRQAKTGKNRRSVRHRSQEKCSPHCAKPTCCPVSTSCLDGALSKRPH